MPEIMANTNTSQYPIYLKSKFLSQVGSISSSLVKGHKVFVVTDSNVAEHYLNRVVESLKKQEFQVFSCAIPAGEESKTQEMLFFLYEQIHQAGITRSDLIVALGGGVVGDLTGYAAATYMRGIPLLQIPTSLLAQVDSSVGGKTAIDTPYGKNIIGAFYQPKAVIVDPSVLTTLPRNRFAEGMAEVIKYGCIRDEMLFEAMEKNNFDLEWLLERCIKIKTKVVQNDEFDNGERMILNFGHTLGHAIEKVTNYQTYAHGEAVAIGMVYGAKIGEQLKITPAGTCHRIIKVLQKWDLPVDIDVELHPTSKSSAKIKLEDLWEAMLSDKKKLSGKVYYVLLSKIGQASTYPMTPAEVKAQLEQACIDLHLDKKETSEK